MADNGGNDRGGAELCPVCGKQKGSATSGSSTSWIYRESFCTCGQSVEETLPPGEVVPRDLAAATSDVLPAAVSLARQTDGQVRFGERYEIVERLGQGGAASLYKVNDLVLNQSFAIKIIRSGLGVEPVDRDYFRKEARAVRELSHANIVPVYTYDISPEGIPFLIMDYVKGKHLGDFIADGRLTEPLFYQVFNQILSALAHAHSQGVVHRDLKPSNILLSEVGARHVWVKVVDFGISGSLRPKDDGTCVGSPAYISPELARREPVDARADIYSLGCVMFESLAGRPPFVDSEPERIIEKHLNEEPPGVIKLGGRAAPGLEKVILKCLEKDPLDRYQNAFDLRSDLELVAAGKEPHLSVGAAHAPTRTVDTLSALFDFEKHSKLYDLETLFEGQLSPEVRLDSVLERVLKQACPGDTLLALESGSEDFSGVIVVRDGHQVLGAKIMKDPASGYVALRRLIAMKSGSFKYSRINARDYSLPDLSLNLNLNFILYVYPGLPESLSDLLDQTALRDLITGAESDGGATATTMTAVNVSTVRGTIDSAQLQEDAWVRVPDKQSRKSSASEFQDDNELKELTRKKGPPSELEEKAPDYRSFKQKVSGGHRRPLLLLLILAILGFGLYVSMSQTEDDAEKSAAGQSGQTARVKKEKGR